MTGGRWNPRGTEAIYTASSKALAVLEVLVHYSVLPRDFVMTEIRIPVNVKIAEVERAYVGWVLGQPLPPISESQEIASQIDVPVLSVPSAIISEERNFVIYPAHPSFSSIEFYDPVPFQFDPRLKSTEASTH